MQDLRELRISKGKTMQELGDALGITRQGYMRIERNQERTRIDQAVVIGKVLGEDPRRIFFA